MPWKLAIRDVLLVVATVASFSLDAVVRATGDSPLWLAVLAALSATASAFYLHEWGHLVAARAVGAPYVVADRVLSLFLFRFDVGRGTAREFLWMSFGGFVASAGVLVAASSLLPLDALSGRLALGLILLGIAATIVTEAPVAWRVARGGPLPNGIVYVVS